MPAPISIAATPVCGRSDTSSLSLKSSGVFVIVGDGLGSGDRVGPGEPAPVGVGDAVSVGVGVVVTVGEGDVVTVGVG